MPTPATSQEPSPPSTPPSDPDHRSRSTTTAPTTDKSGEAYPGELAMLRGVLAVLRTVAQHGDMDEVNRILTEHEWDERAAYDKTTPNPSG